VEKDIELWNKAEDIVLKFMSWDAPGFHACVVAEYEDLLRSPMPIIYKMYLNDHKFEVQADKREKKY
jgi:hypothetical protein